MTEQSCATVGEHNRGGSTGVIKEPHAMHYWTCYGEKLVCPGVQVQVEVTTTYFLEHPRRGIVVDLPGDRDEKFHFSWSKPRGEALMMTQAKALAWLVHPECPPETYVQKYERRT